jgi:hypothetical protein
MEERPGGSLSHLWPLLWQQCFLGHREEEEEEEEEPRKVVVRHKSRRWGLKVKTCCVEEAEKDKSCGGTPRAKALSKGASFNRQNPLPH